MKQISDKQYEQYMKMLDDKRNGRNLTFEALEMIVKANNFDAEKVGKDILEAYWRIKKKNE